MTKTNTSSDNVSSNNVSIDSNNLESNIISHISLLELQSSEELALLSFLDKSEILEVEKIEFVSNLNELDKGFLNLILSTLKRFPNINLNSLNKLVLESLKNNESQLLLSKLTPIELNSYLSLIEYDNSYASKIVDAISKINTSDEISLQLFSDLLYDLDNKIKGNSFAPDHYSDGLEAYSNAPDPFSTIIEDINNLNLLNSEFNGFGQFQTQHLFQLNISSALSYDADNKMKNILSSIQNINNIPEISSVNDILNLVAKYKEAGGKDVVYFLGQLGDIADGIIKIKTDLGYNSDTLFVSSYESYLLDKFVISTVNDSLPETLSDESEKIKLVFPDKTIPLDSVDAMSYQVMGYLQVPENIVLANKDPNSNTYVSNNVEFYKSTAPHPGSALNSSSIVKDSNKNSSIDPEPITETGNNAVDWTQDNIGIETGLPVLDTGIDIIESQSKAIIKTIDDNIYEDVAQIEFPSLSDYGDPRYTDISESPLYSEKVLQENFNGNVKDYAIYLAQAHYLLESEDVGLKISPDMYDGVGDDELNIEQIQAYLFQIGNNPQTILGEIQFIQRINNEIKGNIPEGTEIPAALDFDPLFYISSGGREYEGRLNSKAERPVLAYETPYDWPDQFMALTKSGYASAQMGVEYTSIAINYHQSASTAQSDKANVIHGLAGQETADIKSVTVTDENIKDFDDAALRELMYLNLAESLSSQLSVDEAKKYINSDGTTVLVYDDEGKPIKNQNGTNMTLREFEAIKKYVPKELISNVLPGHENIKINGKSIDELLDNPSSDKLRHYYVNDFNGTSPLESPFKPNTPLEEEEPIDDSTVKDLAWKEEEIRKHHEELKAESEKGTIRIVDLEAGRYSNETTIRSDKASQLSNSFNQDIEKLSGYSTWLADIRSDIIKMFSNINSINKNSIMNWY